MIGSLKKPPKFVIIGVSIELNTQSDFTENIVFYDL